MSHVHLDPKQSEINTDIRSRISAISRTHKTLLITIAYSLLFVFVAIAHPFGEKVSERFCNISSTAFTWVVAPWCVLPFFRRYPGAGTSGKLGRNSAQWAGLMIGLGVVLFGIGDSIWTYYEEVLHHETPFPSWADVAYVASYPFILAGVLMLPGRPLPSATRGRVVFDAILTISAALTVSWYFVLGPTVLDSSQSWLGKVLGAGYPLGDLVLLFCACIIWAHDNNSALRGAVHYIVVGLVTIVAVDTAFCYMTLKETYVSGTWLDACWPVGYGLIGHGTMLAVRARLSPSDKASEDSSVESVNRSMRTSAAIRMSLPYVLAAVVCSLVVFVHIRAKHSALDTGVLVGAISLVGIIMVRQIFSLKENLALTRSLVDVCDQLENKNKRLQSLSETDSMTGLANHGFMQKCIREACALSEMSSSTVSFILFDVDHFKKYNDSFGHPAGDQVLKSVAQIIKGLTREDDLPARYGGEEFAILLKGCDRETALKIAERVRMAVRNHPFANRQVTVSIGVAYLTGKAADPAALVACADAALYEAKHGGRDQVKLWRALDDGTVDPAQLAALQSPAMDAKEPLVELLESGKEQQVLDMALAGPEGEMLLAMLAALDLRDNETEGHSQRVARYALRMAREAVQRGLKLDTVAIRELTLGSLLHDIGKLSVPDSILRKPGKLTDDEWVTMRLHPLHGAKLLERLPLLKMATPVVYRHHERWDGAGYPGGVKGEEIPVTARLFALADTLDAMWSDRVYRNAMGLDQIRAEVARMSGSQFDPEFAEAFLAISDDEWKRVRSECGEMHVLDDLPLELLQAA